MLAFTIRRVVALIPVLLGVSVIVFLFLHLIPGDPAQAILGERATDQSLAALRRDYGLDQPWPTQYVLYLERTLHGDLGRSLRSKSPVTVDLSQRLPATIELAVASMLIAIVVGVPAGIVSATRRGSALDHGSMLLALVGVSMPIFWLGLVLAWIFGVQLKWLPFSGRLDNGATYVPMTNLIVVDALVRGNWALLGQALRHLALPALALSTVPMAIIARITRASLLEVLGQDFIRTARAKGLSERTVTLRHALRNAMLPVITTIGLQVGLLLSGAILTETIFAWPGIGRWIFESIQFRDYPVVQSMTLLIAMIFVSVNLLVDLSYAFIDPRVRLH